MENEIIERQILGKINELEIDERFKENSVYDDMISSIRYEISRGDSVSDIKFENGTISFDILKGAIKDTVTIKKNDSGCLTWKKNEKNMFLGGLVNETSEATSVEEIHDATLYNTGIVNSSFKRKDWKADGAVSGIKVNTNYDSDGIALRREETSFESNLELPTRSIIVDRNCGNFGNSMFDVARVVVSDSKQGTKFNSLLELDSRHLSDLMMPNLFRIIQVCEDNNGVTINSLSQEEILSKLKDETNSKKREALLKLTAGRNEFSYDSALDPEFTINGQTPNMSSKHV